MLSDSRRKENTKEKRSDITSLHALHRDTFMGERKKYYHRRHLGLTRIKEYLSTISDGMAQLHNELPWRANLAQFTNKLRCHLLGFLVHGKRLNALLIYLFYLLIIYFILKGLSFTERIAILYTMQISLCILGYFS